MNTSIKKMAMLGLLAGMSSSVLATTASDSFQWTGTVPADPISGTFEIFNKGVVDFTRGSIVFARAGAAGNYEIQSSSSIAFGVREVATSNDAAAFDYEVQTLRYSTGGLMMPVDPTAPEFAVVANGTPLTVGTEVSSTVAGETIELQVSTPAATNVVAEGDEVIIQSVILVTNATI